MSGIYNAPDGQKLHGDGKPVGQPPSSIPRKMPEQDQQIALCEHFKMGRTDGVREEIEMYRYSPFSINIEGIKSAILHLRGIPDTNSLDVLHSMKLQLTKTQRDAFAGHLSKIVCVGQIDYGATTVWTTTEILFATAAQERKALLLTLNLWREDSN